jgi:sulfite exporter TauE/SafE
LSFTIKASKIQFVHWKKISSIVNQFTNKKYLCFFIAMAESFASFPLLFGIVAALAHVLSGPDHLAAIGPLAINANRRAWMIGMSWGIGHLTGMLMIGVLFFYLKEFIPVEFISANSEKMVGILLIVIGLWALYKMLTYHPVDAHEHDHTHSDESGSAYVHRHSHQHHETTVKHQHTHEMRKPQTYLAALGIGILHGLAGISHFIGLLPTLAFESRFDSAMYLSGFGIGTILAMVLFSSVLGLIAGKADRARKKLLFQSINGIAGISAIFVGIFWLWSSW